ncbi:MAG: hypothetical protein AAGI15_00660 [Pseudomonadota bacterium]
MSETTTAPASANITTTRRRRWPWILLLLLMLGFATFRVAQYRSDGPLTDLIPGGELRSGELIADPLMDPTFETGATVELQLRSPARSRYVGLMRYEGALYIPCDLGFMWGRFEGMTRHVLHLVYRFKSWHQDVLADGAVVLRYDGKRYARRAVRVTDSAQLEALKAELEALARAWVAPEVLGPPPTSGPRDIWFFRLDPLSATQL